MIAPRHPAGMTAQERLSELAALLGAAYVRLLSRQKALETAPPPEALLDAVKGQEMPGKEAEWKTA